MSAYIPKAQPELPYMDAQVILASTMKTKNLSFLKNVPNICGFKCGLSTFKGEPLTFTYEKKIQCTHVKI